MDDYLQHAYPQRSLHDCMYHGWNPLNILIKQLYVSGRICIVWICLAYHPSFLYRNDCVLFYRIGVLWVKSVYIVLTQTGTLFSRAIKKCTGDPYNHSSIAFDAGLTTMVSFGRKGRYNVFRNGLIEEGFDKGLFCYFPQTRCCVLEIPVLDRDYHAMRDLVDRFFQKQDDYRYNLLGVLGNWVGVGLARENHFFCSQFVSFVLNETSFWDRDPKLTRPMDFYAIPQASVVFEGSILEFHTALPDAISAV